jgi:hypothetical protein
MSRSVYKNVTLSTAALSLAYSIASLALSPSTLVFASYNFCFLGIIVLLTQ